MTSGANDLANHAGGFSNGGPWAPGPSNASFSLPSTPNGGGEEGTKVTLLQVAELAQVHPSTASRALNPIVSREVSEATRLKVRHAAETLGYRANVVARGLRQGRTGTIGVVITDFEHPHNAAVLRGVEVGIAAAGSMPLVAETHGRHDWLERVLNHLVERRPDAIIVTAARFGDKDAVLQASRFVPVVLAVRMLPGTDLPRIAHDDSAGGVMAARHLLSLGHRRVAEICGAHDVSSFASRRHGFTNTLRADGVVPVAQLEAPMPNIEEGYRLGHRLLDVLDEPPTAIFAHNDLLAAGAIDAFRERGLRCPDDISVVGYDDVVLADHLQPPLTTVRLPSFHLGKLAAELTRTLLSDPATPAPQVTLPPEFIVRGSTAPPGDPAHR